MLEQIEQFRAYLDYIERHYNNVQKAWQLINDKCTGKGFRFMEDTSIWNAINQDVKNHDLSKLSEQEFTQYRQYFFPTKNETKNKVSFEKAWEHHKSNNLHHWQNWTTKVTETPYDDAFVIMMLVDWLAMSYEFGGTTKDYYETNKNAIHLPKWSVDLMYKVFNSIYN